MHDDCVKYDNMLIGHCAAMPGGWRPGARDGGLSPAYAGLAYRDTPLTLRAGGGVLTWW